MHIEENVPLSTLTTFGIGGAARYLAQAQDNTEVREALSFAKKKGLRVLILGGGSNALIDDAGFDGLVIKIEIAGIEIENETLIAGAGESWDKLVAHAVSEKLWGIENLSGIPGTVGGAVAGNIGAYGQALSQTLAWVEVFDAQTGEVIKMTNTKCAFGYRDSFFKHDDGRHVILRAVFALSSTPAPELSYQDLAERFPANTSVDIRAIRDTIVAIRKGKFPDLSVEGTAGSFFKNPIVTKDVAEKLRGQYPQMPLFAMPETEGIKIPLAWLLDKVLDLNGYHIGGARLFERQPLVIVAARGCSASDVRELAASVQEKVFQSFDIRLEPEVKIIS